MSHDVTMVNIGGTRIGLVGLKEIFEQVKELNITDEEVLKDKLLEKVKSQNYVPPSREEEYRKALLREYKRALGLSVEEEEIHGLEIKILGPGCYACDKLMEETVAALSELGISADVEHVRDLKEIGRYGIVGTPGLVINRKVRSSGKLLNREQLKRLILQEVDKTD